MQHKPIGQMDDLLSGCDNYIKVYAAFLQSGHIPPCLEDDMYRLLQFSQSAEEDTDNTESGLSLHSYIHCT